LDNISSEKLHLILKKFSGSIKANISKFGLEKLGIDPDDILQEVMIKIWKRIAPENKIKSYSSYINRITNSTLIDFIRKSRRQEKLIYHEMQKRLIEKECNYDEALEHNVLKKAISTAIDSLIESRRKVIKLYLSDLTIEEISLSLNWTKDKTRNLLYRGLSDLKSKLKEQGIEYEDRQ
jgi:RNA polymerase sigma factor (sigma-70 family)